MPAQEPPTSAGDTQFHGHPGRGQRVPQGLPRTGPAHGHCHGARATKGLRKVGGTGHCRFIIGKKEKVPTPQHASNDTGPVEESIHHGGRLVVSSPLVWLSQHMPWRAFSFGPDHFLAFKINLFVQRMINHSFPQGTPALYKNTGCLPYTAQLINTILTSVA